MKSLIKYKIAVVLALVSLAAFPIYSSAQDSRTLKLDDLLQNLVKTHDRILASEAQLKSVKHQYESARGGWYPHVDVTAEGGRENLNKPRAKETQMDRNEMTVTGRQLLYDFGGISGTIDAAQGKVMESESALEQTKQEIISMGIAAYLRVIRSRELLKYARRSEESVKELSGMQEMLVERGAGYSYEELQVKGQLAGTQSYRVTQERELQISLNNFKSVFGFTPTMKEVRAMSTVPLPRKYLPANVDVAIATAFDTNPSLLEIKYSAERLQGELRSQDATFYPRFDAVVEGERKENDQGTAGVRTEGRAGFQMAYNLFSGFSDTEESNAIKSEITRVKKSLQDRRRTVEENVRNAWQELTTLKKNAELYENQANITWEFLGLVKKKKATGEDVRLLDILVGERDYISAISAKVATDIDIIIAGYSLLYQMGLITENITHGI
ncbi:TolC family protein [Pseudodesulfovibrio sp.]|uniref:TolC family protein n=1 Tax=unclassified Pseudodesulfovibrio TaxID=2661612 RepID=UPI003AFF65EF